ncbi:MAG: hypothetical protein RLZ80_59, partial [Actinomycetota bacterium]
KQDRKDRKVREVRKMSQINLDEIRAELSSIEGSDLPEHVARYEALHAKLTEALKSIDEI